MDTSTLPPAETTNVFLDAPYGSVRWDDHEQWVVSEVRGWANSTEFRAMQETTLRAVQAKRASRLLVDGRNAKVVVMEDERWLSEIMIPRLALAGVRWTAFVTPVNALAQAISLDIAKSSRIDGATSEHFGNLDAAKAWLSLRGER
jgi:hypothetical protein